MIVQQQPRTLGAFENPGGAGAMIFLYGPPIAGAVIGAIVGGDKHRLAGGGIGLLAGIAAMLLGAKLIQASQPPVQGP